MYIRSIALINGKMVLNRSLVTLIQEEKDIHEVKIY